MWIIIFSEKTRDNDIYVVEEDEEICSNAAPESIYVNGKGCGKTGSITSLQ